MIASAQNSYRNINEVETIQSSSDLSRGSTLAVRAVHKNSAAHYANDNPVPIDGNVVSLDDLEAFLDKDSRDESSRGSRGRWDKPDGRLFYQYPLYVEGMLRPTCRGVLHMLVSVFVLPPAFWYILRECNGNMYGIVSSSLYVLSVLFCYGISALFHVGRCWSAQSEILLQKLDHAGIAITSVGTFLPSIFLLFPVAEGALFLIILLALLGYNVYSIVKLRPSVIALAVIPAVSVLFLPRIWVTFTSFELTMYFSIVIFKFCGTLVYVYQRPDPIPKVFGFHEIFHTFVVLAGSMIYLANFSIVRRTCNPYSHHVDVGEHLMDVLGSYD